MIDYDSFLLLAGRTEAALLFIHALLVGDTDSMGVVEAVSPTFIAILFGPFISACMGTFLAPCLAAIFSTRVP